jgi:hypothetical protein
MSLTSTLTCEGCPGDGAGMSLSVTVRDPLLYVPSSEDVTQYELRALVELVHTWSEQPIAIPIVGLLVAKVMLMLVGDTRAALKPVMIGAFGSVFFGPGWIGFG